jgi:hypothetical protein
VHSNVDVLNLSMCFTKDFPAKCVSSHIIVDSNDCSEGGKFINKIYFRFVCKIIVLNVV